MDISMKRTFTSLSLIILSMFCLARVKIYPDSRPIEFLQSLVLGSNNITVRIPRAYQMIKHESNHHQHILGFIFDRDSPKKWSQYIGLNIINNTQESAAMRVQSLQHYLRQNYTSVKILDTDVYRAQNGLQDASISITYEDEEGYLVVVAQYYSDSASLVGVEVSQRVKNNIATARKSAEKVAASIIDLSNT